MSVTFIADSNPIYLVWPSLVFDLYRMVKTMKTVTIYTTPTCPYCVSAKALLRKKGLEFNEIGIEGDRAAAFSLARRTGRATVPQIFVGTKHIGGFEDLQALEQAGHLEALLGHAAPGS
jgi:glutaredoxin 3